MRLDQLDYLTAVTRHGSLRRASEELHLSQPALSEAISKLERDLGVTLLDRRRSGARISHEGRELLPHLAEVSEAVARLRTAAGGVPGARVVRVGTVGAATSTLLAPAVQAMRAECPQASVEVTSLQQAEIDERLVEGTLHLGLVNTLDGDDDPAGLRSTPLLHGQAVVVLPSGHPLTAGDTVSVEDLRAHPFVAMREGYLMARVARRVFGEHPPAVRFTTDGADLGKLMVAEGAGLALLPGFSVDGDPLHRSGQITHRPLSGTSPAVTLRLRSRAGASRLPEPVQVLGRSLRQLATRAA
ncbi:LysR family transcriptional regulator [Nocardioides rotundus]|uniref:LysR family transcriptional regulator n=1 Tax=Nocardioides rotundus TaxID=1774216 RepID=UPI001CBAB446|nr:LysR family transcriptional regulator [Nocardioides rotundus]UAL30556.1 LysR family transcriptional regulator [Nocardioides rotundus]